LRSPRVFWRQNGEAKSNVGRGDLIWDHHRGFRGLSLVRTFSAVDGNRGYCSRHIPRPSANGDSNLFAVSFSWPNYGYLSYDPCGAVGRGDTHWRILIARWRAVGGGIDEHRRCASRDGHIRNYAARSAHPIAQLSIHSDYLRGAGNVRRKRSVTF